MNFLQKLSGYKTYISASLLILYTVLGMVYGNVPLTEGIMAILGAFSAMGLRGAVAKVSPVVPVAPTPVDAPVNNG